MRPAALLQVGQQMGQALGAGPGTPPWWAVAGCATLAALAAATAGSAWVAQRNRRTVLARLARHTGRAGVGPLGVGATTLSPASDTAPWRARLLARLVRWVPAPLRTDAAAARLAHAGYFAPEAAVYYGAMRLAAPVLVPVLVVLATGSVALPAIGLGLTVGLVGPSAVLDHKAGARRTALTRAIPDALDLLIVCLEAGVGLDAALVRVGRELGPTHPILAAELEHVTRRTGAGLPREEALRALVTRTGIEDLRGIVSTMVQAERLGTSLARVLRIHGESLRTRRKQLAEKKAAEASVKMVIPLVLFLLPAFFAIVLGPAVLGLLATMREP